MADVPPPFDENDPMDDFAAAANIGEKVLEMVDRLKVAHACAPGSVARWGFTVEDTRYELSMIVSAK